MPAPYSDDLRQKAIAAVERGESKSHVCREFQISRNTLHLWLKRLETTGSVGANRDYQRGPQPKIADLDAFRTFAQQHGHRTQQAMAEHWPEPISDWTIGKALKRIGFTRKKTYGYRERDEQQRQAFLKTLQNYTASQLVYVDEAGVDDTEDYPYGWCHQSERFSDLKLGHRTQRISMIAGWCNRQVLAPLTFEGYCNTALVEAWVEHVLVPELEPGQVVVIDNASFHKSVTTRQLIEAAGCELLFLPPYSPDLNKIEKFWARLKQYSSTHIR
ncbi:MAG: IS630 family transposase [Cyanobacteria bacterium P01_F01_bin.3]